MTRPVPLPMTTATNIWHRTSHSAAVLRPKPLHVPVGVSRMTLCRAAYHTITSVSSAEDMVSCVSADVTCWVASKSKNVMHASAADRLILTRE